jgi:hypothetical protein
MGSGMRPDTENGVLKLQNKEKYRGVRREFSAGAVRLNFRETTLQNDSFRVVAATRERRLGPKGSGSDPYPRVIFASPTAADIAMPPPPSDALDSSGRRWTWASHEESGTSSPPTWTIPN